MMNYGLIYCREKVCMLEELYTSYTPPYSFILPCNVQQQKVIEFHPTLNHCSTNFAIIIDEKKIYVLDFLVINFDILISLNPMNFNKIVIDVYIYI